MRRPLPILALVWLTACGGSQEQCKIPTPPVTNEDCAALSGENWRIGPFPTPSENEFRLATGESKTLFLAPFVDPECASAIASVTWSAGDSSVVSVDPKSPAYDGSWVTGRSPGSTTVTARIVFADGRVQQPNRVVLVSPAMTPPGSTIVAEGTVELEGYSPSSSTDSRRYVPFTLPQDARQVDATLDWSSLANKADIVLFSGTCSGGAATSCPGLSFVASPRVTNVKPLPVSAGSLAAGPYTLRIDNLGPGRDTFRYEVRLTPR